MRLQQIPVAQLVRNTTQSGIGLQFGPFNIHLRTDIAHLVHQLRTIYPHLPLLGEDVIYDYRIRMQSSRGLRRWLQPQATFHLDHSRPFQPYPRAQALPLFEWGLNWCIGTSAHQYILLHAAVLARHGNALIMPAAPGAGKSTLAAALACRGWHFLTDEIGLVRPADGMILPLPRAIPLKNASIDLIQSFAPNAILGPRFAKTRKGTVAHMAPPDSSVDAQSQAVRPRWIVFPRYREGARFTLEPELKSRAFTRLAHNSFNYEITGEKGFVALSGLVDRCACHAAVHSDLTEAVEHLTELAERDAAD